MPENVLTPHGENQPDVGEAEVSAKCDTGASNHPQSLWISLWIVFGHPTQVTYRKGFFFGRSKNERCDLALIIMQLRIFCPLRQIAFATVTIWFPTA